MGRLTVLMRPARLLSAALLIGLAGALHEGYGLLRAERINRALAEPAGIEVTDNTVPELVYAKAFHLAEKGDRQEAIRLYSTLTSQGDEHFRARVRHNLGTLYLRDAAALWNARGVLEYIRVNTLVAAAKENLRESLRLEPGRWDARYNLEYAHRITPPPKEKPKADFQGSKSSVFATIPALPGGGP